MEEWLVQLNVQTNAQVLLLWVIIIAQYLVAAPRTKFTFVGMLQRGIPKY